MWVLVKKRTLVTFHTVPSELKGVMTKGGPTDVTCFVRAGLRFVFTFNTSRRERRGGQTGIHKLETPLRRKEMKGETRLCVSSSLLSTNHSEHLFMLDLYSTSPPPVSSIKHSFMSLHPFVQLGQIILCSGMSPEEIYVPSEWMHLIYWCMQIFGGLKKKKPQCNKIVFLWSLYLVGFGRPLLF